MTATAKIAAHAASTEINDVLDFFGCGFGDMPLSWFLRIAYRSTGGFVDWLLVM